MANISETARPLVDLQASHSFFVGIDSDGCAFDTMEIKHKECFTPNIIKHWDLQAVSKYAREACEFVNLYSKWRGINRWPALVMVMDLLRERPEVQKREAAVPEMPSIRQFMKSGLPLSNESLAQVAKESGDPELAKGLVWSKAVNATIADMVHGVPPFPYVRESLAALQRQADIIVVSQTPEEALVREWQEHGINAYVSINPSGWRAIAGQERGTKSEHIRYASQGKYADDHKLMIGDAPGDLKAARDNNALFCPINPGREDESWQRFFEEGLPRFLNGTYAGDYEASLAAEFDRLLPDLPPWKRK